MLGKGQEAVRAALPAISQALPFALRGIDSEMARSSLTIVSTPTARRRGFSSRVLPQ